MANSPIGRVILDTAEDVSLGYVGVETSMKKLVGQTGIAKTVLRPSGKVVIDDELYDAKAEEGFIEEGTEVLVTSFSATQLYVVKKTK